MMGYRHDDEDKVVCGMWYGVDNGKQKWGQSSTDFRFFLARDSAGSSVEWSCWWFCGESD